jgi:putative transposase
MSHLAFVPKSGFLLMGKPYTISSMRKTEDRTEVEAVGEDGRVYVNSLEYLFGQYEKGNLKGLTTGDTLRTPANDSKGAVLRLVSDLPQKTRDEAIRRANLLSAIADAGGFQRGNTLFWEQGYAELARRYGFKPPPDRSTILRWIRKARGSEGVPLAISLAPRHELKGGKGKTRMSAAVLQITETCLQDVFLSSDNTPLLDCHGELVRRIDQANLFLTEAQKLQAPSYGQLRRHLASMDAYDIFASKHGRASAEDKFRLSRKVTRRFRRALERVEIDHTPLDIFLCDSDGVVIGRAYLTVVVDKRTRAILGFCIGLNAPSRLSALRAIAHAVRPKTYLRGMFPEIQNDWLMYGLFELLVMDNGSEFHSHPFQLTIMELELAREIAYMPRRKGYYKGLVETLQKYLNLGVAAGQPGATQSHHWQRNKERPPEEYAVHTLESLTKLLHIWICDVYHVEVKDALSKSINETWKELTEHSPVRLPSNPELLELACTLPITRKLQAYGVEVCYLRTFNNAELERLMRKYQHAGTVEVEVRYKPHLLDKVWVKDPDTQAWLVVENYDSETRNSTEWREQQIHRQIRIAQSDSNQIIGRAQAKAKLREIGTSMMAAKTMAKRRHALKLLGLVPHVDLIDTTVPAEVIDVVAVEATPKKRQRPKPTKKTVVRTPNPSAPALAIASPAASFDYTALRPLQSLKG